MSITREIRRALSTAERSSPRAPAPDLVVYLQAQPATLYERVRRRASTSEGYATIAQAKELSAE